MKYIPEIISKLKPKKMKNKDDYSEIINFLFEVGYLRKIKRSQRKRNDSSIAEHSFRTAIIGYFLAKLTGSDVWNTTRMCLFHDLAETRTGDADSINKLYLSINEEEALNDILGNLFKGKEIKAALDEFNQGESYESKLAHDADVLEEMLTEKEQFDRGEKSAEEWMLYSLNRNLFKTSTGKDLASRIINANSDSWWHEIIGKKKRRPGN